MIDPYQREKRKTITARTAREAPVQKETKTQKVGDSS
jgi:hypothetical protein